MVKRKPKWWLDLPPLPLKPLATLCATCSSFQLSADSFAARTTYKPHHTGTGCIALTQELAKRPFTEMQLERDCGLCQLICSAVEEQYPIECQVAGAYCQLQTKRHEWDNLSGERNYRVLQIFLKSGKERRESETPVIHLLPVVSNLPQWHGCFTGKRINPSLIDVAEVRCWIDECQRWHKGPCLHFPGSGFDEISQHLRVVDTENICLTALPEGARYSALSYVWGQDNGAFEARRNNIREISKPYGLFRHLDDLPLVIRDALIFTKAVGERYIWIDRICIVQDDNEEKSRIIPKMNVVYSSAFLTIFSSAWGGTSAGLSGLRPFSPHRVQKSVQLAGDLEIILPHNLENLLVCPWASRGWTFQEFFSARRKVVFVNGQAVYICRNGSRREDLTRSHTTIFQKFCRLGPAEWQPPLWTLTPTDVQFSYMRYIEVFVRRNLRFDSDILDAFAGVINYFRVDFGLTCTYGILDSLFGLDIHWYPEEWLERREGFPSWSWAGWKGPIRKSRYGLDVSFGRKGIRERYSSRLSWLASLYFLAFYIYEKDDKTLRLISKRRPDLHGGRDYLFQQTAGKRLRQRKSDSYISAYPPLDLDRDLSFDPRGLGIPRLCSSLIKVAPQAQPRLKVDATIQNVGLLDRPTLFLRTIVVPVWISTSGPEYLQQKQPNPDEFGDSFEDLTCPRSRHVYLSAADGTILGLAWLCQKETYDRLHQFCSQPSSGADPLRACVNIAITGGPVAGNWKLCSDSRDIDMSYLLKSAQAHSEQFSTDNRDEVYIRTWTGGNEIDGSDTESDSLRDDDSDEDAASLPDSNGPSDVEESIPSDVAIYLPALGMGFPEDFFANQPPIGVDDPLNTGEIEMEKTNFGSMYCPGILLWGRNRKFSDSTDDGEAIHERIGLGELREDLLCKLKDSGVAQWKDVYIQ